MDEATHRVWDVALKITASAGAIVAFLYGVDRHVSEQRETAKETIAAEERIRERTLGAELFRKDLETFAAIAKAASAVAVASTDSGEFSQALKEYEQMYLGNVTSEDEPELVLAMDALRQAIDAHRKGYAPADKLSSSDLLKIRANEVSKAVRKAVSDRKKRLVKLSP